MSLANTYRPSNFDTVVGQEHIKAILQSQMKSDKEIHHNYIFFGPRGTGKTTMARILAKSLNCTNLQDGNPCDQCESCIAIKEGKIVDYVEIDAASHTGVDNIREEIIDKLQYPPVLLKKKLYVIDEVHMLSKGAFNALLKTMEEPKGDVCFILATTEIQKVPETIISRCQVFNFRKIPTDLMIAHLAKVCEKEGLQYQDTALLQISKISEGCVRDAMKYVDQISILGEISDENVSKILGIASNAVIEDFLAKLKEKNQKEIFENIDELSKSGIDLAEFAKQVIMHIDSNLDQDTDFYLEVAKYISEIVSKIRYYPYPKIVYKIAINEYLSKDNNTVPNIDTTKKSQVPSITKENIETKVEDKAEVKEEDKAEVKEEDNKTETQTIVSGDLDVLQKLIDKMEAGNLKTMLAQYTKLKSVQDNKITLIVINKMTELALKNQEKKDNIEAILSEIIGKPAILQLEYMSKEDFFKLTAQL